MTPADEDFASTTGRVSADTAFQCCCLAGIGDRGAIVRITAACCPLHGSLRVPVPTGFRVDRQGEPDDAR